MIFITHNSKNISTVLKNLVAEFFKMRFAFIELQQNVLSDKADKSLQIKYISIFIFQFSDNRL